MTAGASHSLNNTYVSFCFADCSVTLEQLLRLLRYSIIVVNRGWKVFENLVGRKGDQYFLAHCCG
jgi:hypothetical protein